MSSSNAEVVVMPMISGKTTLSRNRLINDVDDVATDALEARLRPLREANDWDAHGKIWFQAIRDWVAGTAPGLRPFKPGIPLAVHDLTTAKEVMPAAERIFYWMPNIKVFARRLAVIAASHPERAELAIHNRHGVVSDERMKAIPLWDGLPKKDAFVYPHFTDKPR